MGLGEMSNLKVWIFFAIIIEAWANLKNIQMSTYDGISENCGGSAVPSPFTKIGEKYYFIGGNEKVNWFEAGQLCRRLGADLATIESAAEMNAVSDYLLSLGYNGADGFYISLNDLGKEGSFNSVATGLPMSYARWSNGQPDNNGGNENCVHLWLREEKYLMNDLRCTILQHYICQIDNPKTISVTVW